MQARPWWRRTRLLYVNLALFALIGVLGWVYRAELRWSLQELPLYVSRDISAPRERQLYVEAASLLREGELDRAEALLRESISIDPYSDAWYWLGRLHLERREQDQALTAFRRLLEFDRTNLDAYLQSSRILERRLALDESVELLQAGLEFFETHAPRFRARLEDPTRTKFDRKALQTRADYERAVGELRNELARVDYKRKLWRGDAPGDG